MFFFLVSFSFYYLFFGHYSATFQSWHVATPSLSQMQAGWGGFLFIIIIYYFYFFTHSGPLVGRYITKKSRRAIHQLLTSDANTKRMKWGLDGVKFFFCALPTQLERLRDQFQGHLSDAKAVGFVVDTSLVLPV